MPEKPNEEEMHSPAWSGWLLIAVIAAGCAAIGYFAAGLVRFPRDTDFQGVLAQQPLPLAGWTVLAMIASVLVCLLAAVFLTRPMDGRLGASLALLALAGFAARGGNMASVMQAADGRNICWLLAGELGVLGSLACACFTGRYVLGGAHRPVQPRSADYPAAAIQTLIFAGMMWLLARSCVQAQAMWSVFFAGVVATLLTHFAIGRIWRGSWSIPIIVGIIGYLVNALTAEGVEIANITTPAGQFVMASPLHYVAMGPIGLIIGEMLHGEENAEDTAAAPTA